MAGLPKTYRMMRINDIDRHRDFPLPAITFLCDSANMKIHFFFCLWYYTTVVLTDVYRLRSLSLSNVIPRFLLGSPSEFPVHPAEARDVARAELHVAAHHHLDEGEIHKGAGP
jgi:hypothetical protein